MSDVSGENKGVGTASTVPNQADAVGGSEDMATPNSKYTRSPAFQFYPISVKQLARMWHGPLGECFVARDGRFVNERLRQRRLFKP